MTDNGDGTYSFNYSASFDGAITILVKLVTANGVNAVWYSGVNWSGSPILTTTYPAINIDYYANINWVSIPGGPDYTTAYFYSTLKGNFIPNQSYYLLTSLVASSPIQITVSWPIGYTSSDPTSPTAWKEICGDGIKVGSETWDDGNTIDGEGWQSNWGLITTGYTWSGGTITTKDIWILCSAGFYPNTSKTQWVTQWGDGLKAGSEQWDDGNTINNDGCQSDWTLITPGFTWAGGGSSSKDVWSQCPTGYSPNSDKTLWLAICGDGLKMATELWDDGNTSNGDGCSNVWLIESGYSCTGGSPTTKDTWITWSAGYIQDVSNPTNWITSWGDGLRAGSESWDDANTFNGDGCSSIWTIEYQYIWNGGSPISKDNWARWTNGYYSNLSRNQCIAAWGDGLRAGSEKCDDGNTSNGDGCKSDCSSVESGWICSGGSTTSKDI